MFWYLDIVGAYKHKIQKNMIKMQEKFKKVVAENPSYSSYTAYAECVRGARLNETTIRRWFFKLVDPGDYAKNEERGVISFIVSLAKPSRLKTPL